MGEDKTAGAVAFFGRSSFDADLKAFKWALKHLKPSSKEYKLWIIHVDVLNNIKTPQESPGSRYPYYDMEKTFKKKYPDYKEMGDLKEEIMDCQYVSYIWGVTYEGANSEAALQHAVDRLQEHEGLDTLVLAWCAADDDTNKGPPINKLESKGCSIILANVNPAKKLTFFMPPTQGKSSASDGSAGTATAPSDIASASSSQTHSSTLSKANTTQPADGTIAANNAQSTSSGLETDTRRSGGGEKKGKSSEKKGKSREKKGKSSEKKGKSTY